MAVSTTWPFPERWASNSAHTTPKARCSPPPPKSPNTCNNGIGAWPATPMEPMAPVMAS